MLSRAQLLPVSTFAKKLKIMLKGVIQKPLTQQLIMEVILHSLVKDVGQKWRNHLILLLLKQVQIDLELTRHGLQMTCTLCKSISHNKRTCPKKDKVLNVQPPLKRSRGHPKNNLKVATNTSHPSYFDVSAQTTSIGSGGRSIRGGQGSRGRGRGNFFYKGWRKAKEIVATNSRPMVNTSFMF